MTNKKRAIFTICSNNYMSMARVLLESAKNFHPDADLYLCVADETHPETGFYPDYCSVVLAKDLDIPQFSQFAFRYDIMEFNTALKPFMFLKLVNQGYHTVLYFDPDIEIFSPLDVIVDALDQGASFVLTPHLLQPAEGDADPDDIGIMRAGIYNLGFCGVGAADETIPILEWWSRRLLFQCLNDQSKGIFVDQKFMDLVPGFADYVHIIRDPSVNVAYWNLAQRSLQFSGNNWLIDGKPLGFFHFSGFDPMRKDCLSKHSSKYRGSAIPDALRSLADQYRQKVLETNYSSVREIPYSYGYFASGSPVTAHARGFFRQQGPGYLGDPFKEFEATMKEESGTATSPLRQEELEHLLEAVYNSSSWRLTQPLRAFKKMFRKS